MFLVLSFFLSLGSVINCATDEFILPVRMPSLRSSDYEEMYLCTSVRIPDDEEDYYVVGYIPQASQANTHHMLMYACENPGMASDNPNEQVVWSCGHDPANGKLYKEAPTCTGKSDLLFAWARDAKELSLPDKVGFHVGKNAGTRHIMVQVHYKTLKEDLDTSGVNVRMTKEVQPKKAGVIIMGHLGSIAPRSTVYMETYCKLPEGDVHLVPIGFRTHTHNLGTVVSGYKVSSTKDKWTLLGKMDPRRAQAFYTPQTEGLVLNGGEYLAARCTMVSDRPTTTFMGGTNHDEMCNYYVMYYVDPEKSKDFSVNQVSCWTGELRSWEKIFSNIPQDASEFEGNVYKSTV